MKDICLCEGDLNEELCQLVIQQFRCYQYICWWQWNCCIS